MQRLTLSADSRYTAWVAFNKCSNSSCPDALADWNRVLARELYNHSLAPVPVSYDMETVNIAEDPNSKEIVEELHQKLKTFQTKPLLK